MMGNRFVLLKHLEDWNDARDYGEEILEQLIGRGIEFETECREK